MSDVILGIDFGNSFSTAAAWIDGKLHFVTDARGEACIPSVVHFPESGPPQIGAPAQKQRRIDPAHTISGVKRILGKGFDSGEVRILAAHTAFALNRGPHDQPVIRVRREDLSPVQLAAYVLRHLRERAELLFGRRVKHAVLTIPASATAETEAATCQAARIAGLEVVRTIHEPTAGALSYRVDRFNGVRRMLVYDFGGGTFDVTVLEQDGNRLVPRVATGDPCLGGDDLDHALAKYLGGWIWRRHKLDVTHDVVAWDRIVQEAERVKRGLSSMPSAHLRLTDAFRAQGRPVDLDFVLERGQVEQLWTPLVDRSLAVSAEALVSAGLRPPDLHSILLVGGTSYVPAVRAGVQRVFGKPGVIDGDPQVAVAAGAALVAGRALSLAA